MNVDERKAIEGRNVLLFDGLCGMCHGTVRFLMQRDHSLRLLYVPLESSLGREMLQGADIASQAQPRRMRPDGEGIVLIEDALTSREVITMRSDAAIRTLRLLGGAWSGAGWLLALVPRWLRELAYGWIARRRYKIFGVYEICPVPSVAESRMILGAGD